MKAIVVLDYTVRVRGAPVNLKDEEWQIWCSANDRSEAQRLCDVHERYHHADPRSPFHHAEWRVFRRVTSEEVLDA